MNLTIDQQNLHLLLPGKLSWMAKMYIDDHKTSVVDALRALYKSPTYASLEQEKRSCGRMGLWRCMRCGMRVEEVVAKTMRSFNYDRQCESLWVWDEQSAFQYFLFPSFSRFP